MDDSERTCLDALLNLLADEVAKRLEERSASRPMEPELPPAVTPVPVSWSVVETVTTPAPELAPEPELEGAPEERAPEPDPGLLPEIAPQPGVSAPSHTASLMARLALGVLLIIVLINIPLNTQGLALAQ